MVFIMPILLTAPTTIMVDLHSVLVFMVAEATMVEVATTMDTVVVTGDTEVTETVVIGTMDTEVFVAVDKSIHTLV